MISNYLIGNKLYLKENISIECAIYYGNRRWSSNHAWVELEDHIDIVTIIPNNGGLIFKYVTTTDEREYIYWCDINTFLKMRCKSIEDIRDDKLNVLGV